MARPRSRSRGPSSSSGGVGVGVGGGGVLSLLLTLAATLVVLTGTTGTPAEAQINAEDLREAVPDLPPLDQGKVYKIGEEAPWQTGETPDKPLRAIIVSRTREGPPQDPEWVNRVWGSDEAYRHEDPIVKLTDYTFEHDTQASTGMTTGSWLIRFTQEGCVHCSNMEREWLQVGIELKGEVNVADVATEMAPLTTLRFNVTAFPEVFFLSRGKMYHYPADASRSWRDYCMFARGDYVEHTAHPMPIPVLYVEPEGGPPKPYEFFEDAWRFVEKDPVLFSTAVVFGLVAGLLPYIYIMYGSLCCPRGEEDKNGARRRVRAAAAPAAASAKPDTPKTEKASDEKKASKEEQQEQEPPKDEAAKKQD